MGSPNKSQSSDSAEDRGQDRSWKKFPIVGIAASAGGLESFTQLLSHLPVDTGMAFVLIQHLDPSRKSLLGEILARSTKMPVQEVENGMVVAPNRVYIIPPNTKMTLEKGALRLVAREKVKGKYMPGDAFFSSLAAELGNRAIAIVLSGTDGDGTQGSQAIKAAGGITLAQCETTAQFNQMPRNAIATGDVDFILPPAEIARKLADIARHPHLVRPTAAAPSPSSDEALREILLTVSSATGVDFSHYKQTTLKRRIDRRMVLYKLEKLADYVKYLHSNADEVQALYQEILIGVTGFFRDPEAYEALKERVFPVISAGKSPDLPIRIWVSGCATGEEVYSIAIALWEFLDAAVPKPGIQIFGTDINENAIDKARLGIYKQNQVTDVAPERLERFFDRVESGYQIGKSIRELCVFARQNLINDPPFSSMDLISCRNVLIYMESVLQKQVMPIFHYGLKPGGFLMLGIAESAGEFSNLFNPADRQHNIYTKKPIPTPLSFNLGANNYQIGRLTSQKAVKSDKSGDLVDLKARADLIVLERYAPIGAIVNENMDIVEFRGETSPYFKLAPGEPTFNLFKMARKGLLEELRTAMHQAKRQNVPIRKEKIQIEGNNPPIEINLEVLPFQAEAVETRYYLVLFENIPPGDKASPAIARKKERASTKAEIERLQEEYTAVKQELVATQEYLQSIAQENDSTVQHLKLANEEILSSNEELQSTNEELQTAKEEIQATNEELHTTNQELHSRNRELHQVNNDLLNLLSSVNIPILILNNDLRIRRFTPTAQRLLNLIPADIGRPLSDIRSTIILPDLESLLAESIETLSLKELEVQDVDGRWYHLRIRPYKTTDNQIDGAVMVLMDIDALKRSSQQLQATLDYAEAVIETVPEPLIVLDARLRVTKANLAFYQMFQVAPVQVEGRSIFELGNGEWNIPELRSLLEAIIPQNTCLQGFEVTRSYPKIGQKTILFNANQIVQNPSDRTILVALHDITPQKEFAAERARLLAQEQSARQEAEASNRSKDEFLAVLSHELRNPLHAILGWTDLLQPGKIDRDNLARIKAAIQYSARMQTRLIEDLLDMSRINRGKLRLDNRSIDVAVAITSAIDLIRPSAESQQIQLEVQLEPDICWIEGDLERLQQIIWNLLSNALKFTPAEGTIAVSLRRVDRSAQIRVTDTGSGISAEFLPHIFEPFRQADSSKTRSHQGLGLGLSIVRHLVDLHGGTIAIDSAGEGLGTSVTVNLPISDRARSPQPTPDAAPPAESIPSLAGVRILVADDDTNIRRLMEIVLEEYGAEVTAIASASEAFSLLAASPQSYDLLISDIGMPGSDGYSLIERVRSLPPEAGGNIPAVAITGYASEEDIEQSKRAGFQLHLTKPIDPEELVEILMGLVG